MNFIRLVLMSFTLIGTFSVQAAEVEKVSIETVQTYTNGTIGIVSSDQSVNPHKCGSTLKYIIEGDALGVNSTLSLLLTAKVSQRLVNIYIDDSKCSSGYPLITSAVLL